MFTNRDTDPHSPTGAYRRSDADCCDRCVLTSIKSTLSRKNTLPLALCVNLRGGGGPATAMRHRAQPGARLWGYRGFKNTRGAGTYTPTPVVSLGLSSGAWSLRPTPQGGAYRIPVPFRSRGRRLRALSCYFPDCGAPERPQAEPLATLEAHANLTP